MKVDLSKPWPCDQPIVVAGKSYAITPGMGTGGMLSPVSVAFTERIAVIENLGACCDFGCGLGLVGMAASRNATKTTLLDVQESVCDLARSNLKNNGIDGSVISDQRQIPDGSIDSIFGSEVVYPSYQLNGLCGFIARAWNRKGPCLLANSDGYAGYSLIARLQMLGFKTTQTNESFALPNGEEIDYILWTILT